MNVGIMDFSEIGKGIGCISAKRGLNKCMFCEKILNRIRIETNKRMDADTPYDAEEIIRDIIELYNKGDKLTKPCYPQVKEEDIKQVARYFKLNKNIKKKMEERNKLKKELGF